VEETGVSENEYERWRKPVYLKMNLLKGGGNWCI
jgi:hypothetical protein